MAESASTATPSRLLAFREPKRWVGVAATIALAILIAIVGRTDGFTFTRYLTFDTYQALMPREMVSAPVTIVAIDDASLAKLGQWPWPRSLVGKLIEDVARHGPASIGIDILFSEADRLSPEAATWTAEAPADVADWLKARPSNDSQLAYALSVSNAALGMAGLDAEGDVGPLTPVRLRGGDMIDTLRPYRGLLRSLPEIDKAAGGHGLLSADPDDDGVVRRVWLAANVNGTVVPSLDIEMLRLAADEPTFGLTFEDDLPKAITVAGLDVPITPEGAFWVHFGKSDGRRFVSAADVIEGKVVPEMLQQKLALIAVTGLGLVDYPATPVAARMAGSEVRAQIMETIFDGTMISRPRWAPSLEGLLMALFGATLVLAVPLLRPRHAPLVWVGGTVALGAIGFGAYRFALLLIDVATPWLAATALFGGLLVQSFAEADRQRRALKRAVEEQREREARLAGELDAARRIQMGILPDARRVKDKLGRIEVAATLEPAKEVGGDLYDVFMLDAHRLFFMVGDVSGKGIPASLFMALGKALYKSVALRMPDDIAVVMSEANDEIARDNAESMFITVAAAILDLRTGEINYASAGHDAPFVRTAAGELLTLESVGGPPLCVMEGFPYPSDRSTLAPGSTVILATDGVSEAHNPAGQLYGNNRFKEFLNGLPANLSAQATVDAIKAEIAAYAAGANPFDDLTLVVVRWLGPAEV